MSGRTESDREIDNELRKYTLKELTTNKTKFNPLTIESVTDGNVRFVSWMRFPVGNNFMIFNMVLSVLSSDPILNGKNIKSITLDKNVISRVYFDYVSYCDKNGVLIKSCVTR